MTPDDDNVLRMLAGATFGPGAAVTLPSGQVVDADEAQALSAVYADDHRHRRDDARRAKFLAHCRSATTIDYKAWLDGWIAAGGQTTHWYDYDLPDSWVVLESDADLPPLHGARAVHVIVPKKVQVYVPPAHSHNNVFWMDGFRADPGWWVPTYRNVRVAG